MGRLKKVGKNIFAWVIRRRPAVVGGGKPEEKKGKRETNGFLWIIHNH